MATRAWSEKDYYKVLGLRPEAAEEEIRKAYRRLALQWHPDRNPGNPDAEECFKEFSEADAVLIDPAKRRDYDRARRAEAPYASSHSRDLFADPSASAIFEAPRPAARQATCISPSRSPTKGERSRGHTVDCGAREEP